MSAPAWTRVRPGLHEMTAPADVDGCIVEVVVWVCERPEWPASARWSVEAWVKGSPRRLTRPDDGPVRTCREAKAAAIDSLRRGWATFPGVGLCGRP